MNAGRLGVAALVPLLALAGCGGGGGGRGGGRTAPVPRRTVAWVGPGGLEATVAGELQRVGVDGLVVRRGRVRLGGGVARLELDRPAPSVHSNLPVGVALTVLDLPAALDPAAADLLWRSIEGELGAESPSELLLDLPEVAPGLDAFVSRLSAAAGVPVTPVLTVGQLKEPSAVPLVEAAGGCVVLTFGELGLVRPGAQAASVSLEEQLRPLAGGSARVRIGVVVAPITDPPLAGWGDPVDPLCDGVTAAVSTRSKLDRTFTFQRDVTWSGRAWRRGESVAARWVDAARLDASLAESGRLVLPELGGWDLLWLPPTPRALGLGWQDLVDYLGGGGPAPEIRVRAERSAGAVRVRLDSRGAFGGAVSSVGNWVEVSVDQGQLAADDPGSFDLVQRGTLAGGEWRAGAAGGATAVRFFENLVSPGESLVTGAVRVPGGRARVFVRWQVTLSTGAALSGSERL